MHKNFSQETDLQFFYTVFLVFPIAMHNFTIFTKFSRKHKKEVHLVSKFDYDITTRLSFHESHKILWLYIAT